MKVERLTPHQMPNIPGFLKDAGFVDLNEAVEPVPIGTWPKDKRLKEVGKYYLVHFLVGKSDWRSWAMLATDMSQEWNIIP
jgi:hypothetical protein